MLAAKARLRHRDEFGAVFRLGRRATRGTLVVHSANRTTPAPESPRAGFVVSKAVGTAVVRNRVKRRLRHLVAERLDTWPANIDVVIRALPRSAEATFQRLAEDLDHALDASRRPRVKGRVGKR